MAERPEPPPGAGETRHEFDAVAEFTVPVELDQKINGAPAPSPEARTAQSLPRLKTAKEFIKGFTPPDYLVDGVLQRGYFYTLTAKTGHGKTAVGLLVGVCTAAGIKLARSAQQRGKGC